MCIGEEVQAYIVSCHTRAKRPYACARIFTIRNCPIWVKYAAGIP